MMYPAFPIILVIWSGMIIGLSFIATPIKFHVSHIALPVALEVGKVTFHAFNIVEWGVLLAAFVASCARRFTLIRILFFLCIAIVLLLQTFWLLPILDERVKTVMAGKYLAETPHHLVYVILEALKLFLLLAMGVRRFTNHHWQRE